MSIKNQNRLPIFALIIIGVTALSLVGLNYLVEAISKTKTSQMAQSQAPSRKVPNLNGLDDGRQGADDAARKAPSLPGALKKIPDFNQGAQPGMRGPPPDGMMRRMRGGAGINNGMAPIERTNGRNSGQKFPLELKERTPPPALPQIPASERPGRAPEPQFDQNQGPPQGWPPPPPPGYYPPPDYYDEGPYYEDEYYDPDENGYEGKLEETEAGMVKTTEVMDSDDEAADEELYMEDEYFNDFFENEEEVE